MHLFSNFQVRKVLVGDRPHPFADYERLTQYWQQQGVNDWTFDTSTTFATLQEIFDKGHTDFHQELYELLWFGGVLSYGNIMRETYAILYTCIDADVLPDIDGLCEIDDGVTFRRVIIQSLRVIRPQHKQALISAEYEKLEGTTLRFTPVEVLLFNTICGLCLSLDLLVITVCDSSFTPFLGPLTFFI